MFNFFLLPKNILYSLVMFFLLFILMWRRFLDGWEAHVTTEDFFLRTIGLNEMFIEFWWYLETHSNDLKLPWELMWEILNITFIEECSFSNLLLFSLARVSFFCNKMAYSVYCYYSSLQQILNFDWNYKFQGLSLIITISIHGIIFTSCFEIWNTTI